MNKIFIDNSLKVENAKRKSSILEALIKGFSLSFSVTIYLGVLILGGYLMYKKNISVGTAIIIIQLSTHIVGPVRTSISLINQIKSVTLIADKINTLLDSSNENLENESLDNFKQCIKVENVKFSYSKDRLALDNINLIFEKNKKYAIVGESGCGKSTLIKMIMRYYTKYEGNIVIDNKNLNSIRGGTKMAKSRLIGEYPVIGIRPTIDARRGVLDVRGSLEEQTMTMAKSAAKLFEENLKYSNGEPVKVVIADTTIGRVPESAACQDKFRREGVDITLTVTPCWCYGSETMDMDPMTIKGVWGFNGTERPGAVYLASVLATHAQKGLPAFGIYG
ncbi:MAG: ATP-binding cassette domain-containing protein, partial [Clostridiales bacterium]|nr:ATP-binding cassette domain-containing protein [Clostridiales bacterium]